MKILSMISICYQLLREIFCLRTEKYLRETTDKNKM